MVQKTRYDLEARTLLFANSVRDFVRTIPASPLVTDDIRQLLRASGSVGANYIEANDCLGKKDFRMRIKICRKEAKESRYWLHLIQTDGKLQEERKRLIDESTQLMSIFGAILRNTDPKYKS